MAENSSFSSVPPTTEFSSDPQVGYYKDHARRGRGGRRGGGRVGRWGVERGRNRGSGRGGGSGSWNQGGPGRDRKQKEHIFAPFGSIMSVRAKKHSTPHFSDKRSSASNTIQGSLNPKVIKKHPQWIYEIERLDELDIVDKLADDLKAFQIFINFNQIPNVKVFSTIMKIFQKLLRCPESKVEKANRILAECLSSRCNEFHNTFQKAVQCATNRDCDKAWYNCIILMANVSCSLLDRFHWSAMEVLPIGQIQKHLEILGNEKPNLTFQVEKIADDLRSRVSNLPLSYQSSQPSNELELNDEGLDLDADLYYFRSVSILPELEELISHEIPEIPPNIIEGRYTSWDHYYDTQFQLLREDFVAPLRQGICDFREGLRGRNLQNIRVYHNVHIIQPFCDRQGIGYEIGFDVTYLKQVQWARSKRLLWGSLVCLSRSDNEFTSEIIFATIADRDPQLLSKGQVKIRLEGEVTFLPWNDHHSYVMVESTAFYEAYRPILKSLQNAETHTMPFKQYLVSMSWEKVDLPAYISKFLTSKSTNKVIYDLTSTLAIQDKPFPTNVEYSQDESSSSSDENELYQPPNPMPATGSINVIDVHSWPHYENTCLDGSQMRAMQMALTQEVALIQGPPGTGKTYMGIKIVEALVHNRNIWDTDHTSPILVVCYTNHALDQFLEGIRNILLPQMTKSRIKCIYRQQTDQKIHIARIGGRANESMKEFAIKTIRKGKIPYDKYEELGDYKSKIEKMEQEVKKCQLLKNEEFISLNFIPDEALNQIQTISPSEDDLDMLFNCWLGLYDVKEEEEEEDQSEVESEEEEYSDVLEIPSGRKDRVKESDNVTEYSRTFSCTESDQETDEETKLVEVENDIAIEEDQRRLDLGSDESDSERGISVATGTVREIMASKEATNLNPTTEQHWQRVDNYNEILKRLKNAKPFSKEKATRITDIINLSIDDRHRLYKYWVYKLQISHSQQLFDHFNDICREYQNLDRAQDKYALEEVDVIGMTTTGAAKYQHILHLVKPKIVIIEEAAEVLESHITSCLTASTEHLILIGDHQQLRPKPNVYDLAKKKNLEISLFERLVKNDFPRVTLEIQHRMRPEIAQLVHPLIYPTLFNHESVCNFQPIKGVAQNLFFIDHEEQEKPDDELRSHSNVYEAKFLAKLCLYLIQQGYKPQQITILCAYTGQLFEVKKYMPKNIFEGVLIRTLDNYQGEENDIVLLSLVRSNCEQRIGFLKAQHRVCVALSRAKMGLYCIGNFKLLEKVGEIWQRLVPQLKTWQVIGSHLQVQCQNHGTQNHVRMPEDFDLVPEGGCNKNCCSRLPCGHVCPRRCHNDDLDHSSLKCLRPCPKTCNLQHPCPLVCSHAPPCPDCKVPVDKNIPECGHKIRIKCSLHPEKEMCQTFITVTCNEGHTLQVQCLNEFDPCMVLVEKQIEECGHTKSCPCSVEPQASDCNVLITVECPKGHSTEKRCKEKRKPCSTPVSYDLPCGHSQVEACSKDVSKIECNNPCKRKFSCGHRCQQKCFQPCNPICNAKVNKIRNCGHVIQVPCHQNPDNIPCNEPCPLLLPCKHKCTKSCGTYCDQMCSTKVTKKLECGHIVEVACGENLSTYKCQVEGKFTLPCKHKLNKRIKCHERVSIECKKQVQTILPCAHEANIPCHKSGKWTCRRPCNAILACGHHCKGNCSSCYQGRLHVTCKEVRNLVRLPCGHIRNSIPCYEQYSLNCDADCDYCCSHTNRKHPCRSTCPRQRCSSPCNWQIECTHGADVCSKACNEPCETSPCDHPCPKPLPCKHPCEGVCGEACLTVCRNCHGKASGKKKTSKAKHSCYTSKFTKQLGCELPVKENYRFLQLDCGHIFEVDYMDRHMSESTEGDMQVEMKLCPKCSKPIYNMQRYRNVTQKTLQIIESAKNDFIYERQCYNNVLPTITKYALDKLSEFLSKLKPPAPDSNLTNHMEHLSSLDIITEIDKINIPHKQIYVKPRLIMNTGLRTFSSQQEKAFTSLLRYILYAIIVPICKRFEASDDSGVNHLLSVAYKLLEGMLNLAQFSFYAGKTTENHITPQIAHDWIQEILRHNFLMIAATNCIKASLPDGTAIAHSVEQSTLSQLKQVEQKLDFKVVGRGRKLTTLKKLKEVEKTLKILPTWLDYSVASIDELHLPLFQSCEMYQCQKGKHTYYKFMQKGLDLFHPLQLHCPHCSGTNILYN